MDHATFGSLPGEIRNRIYEYALYEPEGIQLYTTDKDAETWGPPADYAMTGLTSTCRALRAETLQLYYSFNRLVIHCASSQPGQEPELQSNLDRLMAWCESVGVEQTRVLRKITFSFRYDGSVVGRVIGVLQQQVAKLRGHFHPDAVFDVQFEVPCWDKVGRCLPVNIVLGDRRGPNMARLRVGPSGAAAAHAGNTGRELAFRMTAVH